MKRHIRLNKRRKPMVRRDDVRRLCDADALLTTSLLCCLDPLVEDEGEETPFVAAVLEGLMSDTCSCCAYPPPGHSFPKEG
ncbi:hypothetical protein [Streptomyces sp. NPDC018584]|uniref:hypothetical protein n=1 Tax=unclassified Streptomyces TaxID=2593676 RepID=UPI003789C6E3